MMAGAATSQRTAAVPAKAPGAARLSLSKPEPETPNSKTGQRSDVRDRGRNCHSSGTGNQSYRQSFNLKFLVMKFTARMLYYY